MAVKTKHKEYRIQEEAIEEIARRLSPLNRYQKNQIEKYLEELKKKQ